MHCIKSKYSADGHPSKWGHNFDKDENLSTKNTKDAKIQCHLAISISIKKLWHWYMLWPNQPCKSLF